MSLWPRSTYVHVVGDLSLRSSSCNFHHIHSSSSVSVSSFDSSMWRESEWNTCDQKIIALAIINKWVFNRANKRNNILLLRRIYNSAYAKIQLLQFNIGSKKRKNIVVIYLLITNKNKGRRNIITFILFHPSVNSMFIKDVSV